MGVFALFRRKNKEAAEASTTGTSVVTLTEEGAEEAGKRDDAAVRTGTSEAPGSGPSEEETEAGTPAGGGGPEGPAAVGAGPGDEEVMGGLGAERADAVEIPKQQSAEKAADNEAGEGALK
ncbi:hypothetical protein [Streptomyces sp. NBC_01216]|uniref:hypothetical protein n=1 Tax=unclassified Streptomyces TaxID=2593676 RepID=UPI002E1363C4|nr:hypothetical protein OG393_07145 [Streptomyces sp. NBC_01216]